jgi:tetratricopeptide (TPR) repeat protein
LSVSFEDLVEVVERLATDRDRWKEIAYLNWLESGLRDAVRRAQYEHVEQARFEALWEALRAEMLPRRIAGVQPVVELGTGAELVAERLARAARAFVAAAGAAESALRFCRYPSALEDTVRWAELAAHSLSKRSGSTSLGGPAAPAPDLARISSFDGVAGIVRAAFGAVVGADENARSTARLWSLWLLDDQFLLSKNAVTVPLAAAAAGDGRIVRLGLDELPVDCFEDGTGRLLAVHPNTALIPVDEVFVAGIERAWRAAGMPSAIWSLRNVHPLEHGVQCGDSHSGAAAVAFDALVRGAQLDTTCVVMARVASAPAEGGAWELAPIRGVAEKCRALVVVARRVVVHASQKDSVQAEIKPDGCSAEGASTLSEAIALAAHREPVADEARQFDPIPNETPTVAKHFIGRGPLVDELTRRLVPRPNEPVAVALAGLPGVGKSALAAAVAERLSSHYEIRFWISMGAGSYRTGTVTDVMLRVLESLNPGLRGHAWASVQDIKTRFRDALLARVYRGQRVLVVLDDVRHPEQLMGLDLPKGCGLLVTSELTLSVGGARSEVVLPLASQPAAALLVAISARSLTQVEAEMLARLCGGLPLALVAVGGALLVDRTLTVDSIVDLLTSERRQLLRLRSYRDGECVFAAFEASYAQLRASERRAFRRAAVFNGEFNEVAAREIGALSDAWEVGRDALRSTDRETYPVGSLLGELTQRNLLSYDESRKRYWMHSLVRDFARSKNKPDEWVASKTRHAVYFAELVRSLRMGRDESDHLDELVAVFSREWPNIESGQEWAASQADNDDALSSACVRYATYGAPFLRLSGLLESRREVQWLEEGLTLARRRANSRAEARLLLSLGDILRFRVDYDGAISRYEEALTLCEFSRDESGIAKASWALGHVHRFRDDNSRAVKCYERALAIYTERLDLLGQANVFLALGDVYAASGSIDTAVGHFEQALSNYRLADRELGAANAMKALGDVMRARGEFPRAMEYFRDALSVYERHRAGVGVANTLKSTGDTALARGDFEGAAAAFRRALSIYSSLGDNIGRANVTLALGDIAFDQGDIDRAIGHFTDALDAYGQMNNNPRGLSRSRRALDEAIRIRDRVDGRSS